VSLERLRTREGVYCMLALDHRAALVNAFRKAGVEDVSAERMLETKERIARVVGENASGILLDHAAAGSRPAGAGLLVPLEAQGYEPLAGARLNALEYTAADAVAAGADGCKLLLWYRADHPQSAASQRELVARAAEDCHARGLPLVVEPLVYLLEGESDEAYLDAFPDLVVAAAEELHDDCDLLKLQFPGEHGAERATAAAAPLDWALLGGSEVDGEIFAGQLEIACRAGAKGFIAGRAIWSGCLGLAPEEQERWLSETARPLFDRLSAMASGERLESRAEGG
jgi:tagatose-1,6-bisphosphate aldolase